MLNRLLPLLLLLALPACAGAQQRAAAVPGEVNWGLVIHGGAGTMRRGEMTAAQEAQYRAGLERALRAGHAVLAVGGSSLDAVEAAVNVLEDDSLFNAGRGAVLTSEGRAELDASVMVGEDLRAGAVAGLRRVRNPIDLARRVMEKSPHVMLIGEGAEAFAREQGMELVPEDYFLTDARRRSLQRAREREQQGDSVAATDDEARRWKMGTVGAVALDRSGNIAAATSTGGMNNKRWGRVGDAPIIGAGTYANNRCGGISATGHGEFFIRAVVAYDICAIHLYTGIPLRDAADQVVMEKLVRMGGEGGVIALDMQGNPTFSFNSPGMFRGYLGRLGESIVEIYRD